MDERSKRGYRRMDTLRVALERRRHWARRQGSTVEELQVSGMRMAIEPHRFARRSMFSRHSKKRSGHPKWRGIDRRNSWKARMRVRRLERAIVTGRIPVDWIVAPRGFWGWVESRSPRGAEWGDDAR